MTTRHSRRFGWVLVIGALGTVCGALFSILLMNTLELAKNVSDRTQSLAAWGATSDYAVFYPSFVGDDQAELKSGGHESMLAEASDLYEYLDERGALFIESTDFQPGMEGTPGITVDSITVNTNFLERYPILDVTGEPISVPPDEADWVVAVPDSKRPEAAEITRIVSSHRIGEGELQGAVQAEEEMFGHDVPTHFKKQAVKIIWYPAGQEVFGFNSNVNPHGGGMIDDPIVEIMTPANSLAVDRANSVTGDINTSLKVKLEGTPEETLAELKPLLQELKLDDNLTTLVTPDEVMQEELQSAQLALTWSVISIIAFFLVMLISAVALSSVLVDRQRRVLIVQRLHGFGFLRSYRGVLGQLGILWAAQTLLALLIAFFAGSASLDPSNPGGSPDPFAQFPAIMLIMLVVAVAEVGAASIAAIAGERRNAVKRLKEW